MIKSIALIKRKPGISREEFFRHYEEVHAPLASKYLPFKRYVRNYIITQAAYGHRAAAEEPEFDCIAEFWFDNEEDRQAVEDFLGSEAGQVIRDDEEKFMDRSKIVGFVVEEKVTE